MVNEHNLTKDYSIKVNDYNPHAFCLIRVELDEAGEPCDWTFLYCNDALAKLEGLPKEKLLGHRFFELFPNGSRKWLKPYYESAYGGKVVSFDDISEEIDKYLQIEAFPTGEKGVCACILRNIKGEFLEKAKQSKELRQTMEKLEDEKRLNVQAKQYATAMGIVYPLAIYIDYLKNEYRIIEYEQFLNKTANWSGTVDELIDVGASTIPDKEYADKFKNLFGREKALKAFSSGKNELTLKHPQWGDDGKIHWMETKVICLECTEKKAEAISVSKCIDEEKQVENAYKLLEEQLMVFDTLARNFKNVYFIDLEKETARILKLDASYVDVPGKKDHHEFPFVAVLKHWIDTLVYPEDREKVGRAISVENVKKIFETQDEFVGNYRSVVNGEIHHFQYRLSKVGADGKKAILGFQSIDNIIHEHLENEKAEREKEAAHQKEVDEQLAIINALSKSFRNVFVANMTDGTARVIRLADNYNVSAIRDVNGRVFQFDAVVDRWVRETVHPDDKKRIKETLNIKNIKQIFAKQDKCVGTYRNIEDGVQHYYQYDFRRVGDTETVVAGFQVIDDIVAEQTAHQKDLEEHAEVINSLSTIYSTIFRADIDTHKYDILTSVPLMSKIAASSGNFDDVKEVVIENFVEPDFRKSMREFLDLNTLANRLESVNTVTADYKAPTGQWIQARFIVKRRNENGTAVEALYVARDITKEKNKDLKQQEALSQALAAAQQANKAKTTFLNSMSHDIRTPMNAIIGFTALAQTHLDDHAQVEDYLSKISTSSNHLLSLINDILDMSRIESGTVKLEEKAVHIPDLLHDLRTMIQSLINSKNLNLFIDTQDVVHEDVLTDKLRLNQVLLNIVGNAIKFTQAGGDIIIRLVEKPCNLKHYTTYEFSVKDNGIGMSKEFVGHIFDTFSREYSATVSGIQGTGLGMAITKNIVDMMGGDIQVESEEGKGSLFTVTLSLRLANEPVKNEPIPELLGARALIVDDDMNTCRSVSKMLRDIQMRPDWTTSAKEAIVHAQDAAEVNDEYKVYIIDYLMPDMNGIETVRRIRKVISDDVPIIVLTAYDWTDFEHEAREAGVTAFVSKPIFMSELKKVLTQPVVSEKMAKAAKEKKSYDYSGKHVLLVEDNELNREIATAILEETGMTIDSVEDGDIAVATINKEPADKYDLILMDVQMPRMDGYTATREIRTLADNKKANIPIVAMTANAFEEDKRKAFESGMNGHIIKPISIEEIAKVLDEVFAERK